MLGRLKLDAGGVIGLVITLTVVFVALAAPYIVPHDPLRSNLASRMHPPVLSLDLGTDHLLGADPLGRDILSRLIVGARVSLSVGILATLLAMLIGIPLGLISGFFGGWLDSLLMRIADVQLAFPAILLALALLAALGPSTTNLILVLSISYWVPFARVIRGETLALRQSDFVSASTAIGAGNLRIMLRHLLPNLVSSITVLSTVNLTRIIIAESSLSFLGLGVQPPLPTWGGMLGAGRGYLADAWWVATFPGLAIMITVLGFNLIGDWLRDRFDPKLLK
jgi:peptide/nickel transport system permease protein